MDRNEIHARSGYSREKDFRGEEARHVILRLAKKRGLSARFHLVVYPTVDHERELSYFRDASERNESLDADGKLAKRLLG